MEALISLSVTAVIASWGPHESHGAGKGRHGNGGERGGGQARLPDADEDCGEGGSWVEVVVGGRIEEPRVVTALCGGVLSSVLVRGLLLDGVTLGACAARVSSGCRAVRKEVSAGLRGRPARRARCPPTPTPLLCSVPTGLFSIVLLCCAR